MNQGIGFTPLWHTVCQYLVQYKQFSSQRDNVMHHQLTFCIIGRDRGLFATDLHSSIQLVLRNRNLQQQTYNLMAHPFNTLSNESYKIINNRWHAFNCREEFLEADLPSYPDPHTPSFYFKSEYKNFIKQKQSRSRYLLSCDVIKIKKWKLKIVNIDSTGYYGPAIEAIDYKIDKGKDKVDLTNVSNVIYERKIQQSMEALRLNDIRKLKRDEASKVKEIGLLYYTRERNINFTSNRRTNIMKVDSAQRMLKFYDDPLKYKMILFGPYAGVGCLETPVDQKAIDREAVQNAYQLDLIPFFNYRRVLNRQNQQQKNEGENQMWSSDDQRSLSDGEGPTAKAQPMIDEDSEQNSDNEDPLRNVYLKQFTFSGKK